MIHLLYSILQGLVETVINFVSNKDVLQQFRAVVLAICAVEKSVKIDMETFDKLNMCLKSSKHFIGRSTCHNLSKYQLQRLVNKKFHQFVEKYKEAYQGVNTARAQIKSLVYECKQL